MKETSPRAAHVQSPAWASPSGLVLIVSLLVGGFALLSSALVLASPRTNSTEWALFLLTLTVLGPAAIAGGRKLADRVDATAGRIALADLAAIAAVGIVGVIIAARSSYALGHGSSTVALALALAWAVALIWAARRLTDGRRLISERLADVGGGLADPGAAPAWVVIAGLTAVALVGFFPPRFVHADGLVVALVLAATLVFVHVRWRAAVPRRAGLVLDVAVVVLVVLIVTDVSGYQEYLRPDARASVLEGEPVSPLRLALASRIHEGFYLGPLNDMLHGRAMLVDTSSQYGVGVYYFLADFFRIAPLGYGALGLLAGFLTALQFALAYGVLRLAGVARTLAIPTIVAAVLGIVMGSFGSYNDFPSTGALRYGIPWLIVAVALLVARHPHRRRTLWAALIALVACASVWSFETFAYAGAAFATVIALEAATRERGRRLRTFVMYVAASLAACVVAHMILAVGTRVFAGQWPDWSTYLAYLNAYGTEDSLASTAAPWSPGLPMLLVHLTSLICLMGLVARQHELLLTRRPALIAIASANGLGIASYSYWVGLSFENSLFFLGLPVVVIVALWLSLAEDARARVPNALKVTALAIGLSLAVTLAISGWQETQAKGRRTALAHLMPGTGDQHSLPDALSRLWQNPPTDPRAVQAQALLDRHIPPGTPALVIMEPELTVETLVRSDRINALPISHPVQDNLVPDQILPKLIATVDALAPGTLMLTQPATWGSPSKQPVGLIVAGGLVAVQRLALDRIRSRFRLEIIDRTAAGLAMVRLRPRR